MSTHYELVNGYYDGGYWSIARVKMAVVKKWITAEEYQLITGQE